MKKLSTFILFFFAFCMLHVQAQAPWRAKLFIHFLDSNNQAVIDTVYFGCDSLGADGYQENLDILDTVVKVNHIYGFDSLVQIQKSTGCVNLKQNIKAFKSGEFFGFDFYAIGKVTALSYDTLDFIYNDSPYQIRWIYASSINASLRGIDNNFYIIYNTNRPYNKFLEDSILFISDQSTIPLCNSTTNLPVAHLKIQVGMGYGWVGLPWEIITSSNTMTIYPNPSNDLVNLKSEQSFDGKILFRDYTGKQLKEIPIVHAKQFQLNIEDYPIGIYLLNVLDIEGNVVLTKKIFKN